MEDRQDKNKETPIIHGGYSAVWKRAVRGELDGRSIVARAVRELKQSLINDLGGEEKLSTQKAIILERAVAKTFRCQSLERMFFEGGEMSRGTEDLYLAIGNSLRKDLAALGLKRVPRNITEDSPNLKKLTLEELDLLRTLLFKMDDGKGGLDAVEEERLEKLIGKGREGKT